MTPTTRASFTASMLLLFLLAGWAGGPEFKMDGALAGLAAETREALPVSVQIAAAVTRLGGAAISLSVALLALLYLMTIRKPALALLLALTVLGERALVAGLKDWVARSRPPDGELLVSSMAYPSGHAANSMTVFLVIALFLFTARTRKFAAIAAIGLSLVIGLTRVLLGVHWASDVIGGWALGLATVGAAAAVARRSGATGVEAKHEIVGRHGTPAGKDQSS